MEETKLLKALSLMLPEQQLVESSGWLPCSASFQLCNTELEFYRWAQCSTDPSVAHPRLSRELLELEFPTEALHLHRFKSQMKAKTGGWTLQPPVPSCNNAFHQQWEIGSFRQKRNQGHTLVVSNSSELTFISSPETDPDPTQCTAITLGPLM